MSQYTAIERQSAYQLLCGVMIVDGESAIAEKMVLQEIINTMVITVADVEASRKLNFDICTGTLRNMTDSKRKVLAKCISAVITADGKIHPKEAGIAELITQQLNINPNWY